MSIVCLVLGHRWNFWGLFDSEGGKAAFTKCGRCGKYKDDGKQIREDYING